jgi:hypothetical protein
MEAEMEKRLHMEARLRRRVVSNATPRTWAGLQDSHRPLDSFLFLGPTGVGQTELARSGRVPVRHGDGHDPYRHEQASGEAHGTVARRIGAAPGYMDFAKGGHLTEAVRRRPSSVALFDEVEKAHPEVFNGRLQLLEDGRLTDGHGRTVDFKDTLALKLLPDELRGGDAARVDAEGGQLTFVSVASVEPAGGGGAFPVRASRRFPAGEVIEMDNQRGGGDGARVYAEAPTGVGAIAHREHKRAVGV